MTDDCKTKVLIVDDLPENLLALSKIIAQDDRAIYEALSGEAALALLLEHEFALAILDVMMPGMSGFELAKLMRGTERTRHIPIIFASAGARDLNYAFKGYETGAVDFLQKPLEIAAVKSKVNVFVALHQQRNELRSQVITLEENRRVLHATQEELKAAIKTRDDFMSLVAHELRTPLNTLYIETQLRQLYVESGDLSIFTPAKLSDMIAKDLRQIKSMIRLIGDISDVSRIKSGNLTIQRANSDLSMLVRRIVDDMALQANAAGCGIQLDIEENIVGHWDDFRLEQIVINLLTNAFRYGSGKPVTVSLKMIEGHAEISVRDQGIGISPEDQERIFEKFERIGIKEVKDGVGMGLFIARHLVFAHGGIIKVISKPDEGSDFRVLLPLRDN
jgi:signal transduction histidine kinase